MLNYVSSLMGHAFMVGVLVASTGLIGAGVLSGCTANTGYNSAFAGRTSLTGNSRSFVATTDQLFKTAKITLIQQGFTIEQPDAANGLIKGVRALQDLSFIRQTRSTAVITDAHLANPDKPPLSSTSSYMDVSEASI